MIINIDNTVIQQFPHTKIGLLFGKNVNNQHPSEEITKLLRDAEEKIRATINLAELTSLPKILDWREAYRTFGFKPSEYRSSVEALLRRILQGKQLPTISPLVDLYNLISIKHMLPAGGGDLEKIKGSITLKIAQGSEKFIMLGSTTPEIVKAGEVVYCDDEEVLCRAWNYRESEKTKITEHIRHVYLVIEGLTHTTHEELSNAIAELRSLLMTYTNGSFQEFILDKDHPKIDI